MLRPHDPALVRGRVGLGGLLDGELAVAQHALVDDILERELVPGDLVVALVPLDRGVEIVDGALDRQVLLDRRLSLFGQQLHELVFGGRC